VGLGRTPHPLACFLSRGHTRGAGADDAVGPETGDGAEGEGETLEELLLQQESEEDRLRSISGQFDLRDVGTIELKVDTREMAVSSMGEKLPNLVELKLNGSFVPQLRDLGTSLQQLRVLWLARSHLEELAGIASGLPRLQELYVSFNEIRDVSALAEMDDLEVVDLESNQVSDLEAVDYLSMCPALRSLSLSGNPLAFDQKDGLRHAVATRIPLLEYLDDAPVTEADRGGRNASQGAGDPASTGSSSAGALVDGLDAVSDGALSSEELALIADGIKYARVGIDDGDFEERAIESDVAAGLGSRPSTAAPSLRPGKRPGTGASYASASSTSRGSTPGSRPASALYRTRSGSGSERPSSTGSRGSSGGADGPGVEGGAGGRPTGKSAAKPLAGGAAAALLQRRAGNQSGDSEESTSAQASAEPAACDEHDGMLEELRRWKLETADMVTAEQAEARELVEALCNPIQDERGRLKGEEREENRSDAPEKKAESRPSRPLDSAGARSNVPQPPHTGHARPVGTRSGKPPRPMSASIKDLYQFVKGENDIQYFNSISTKLYSDEE